MTPTPNEGSKTPSKIEVGFLIPGFGSHKEVYDLTAAADVFCWKANCKRTAAIQTGVKVLEEIEASPDNLLLLQAAQNEANKMMDANKGEF